MTEVALRDRVAMPWLAYACGTCDYCVSGWETLCLQQKNIGYGIDGCFGEYAAAFARYVVKVPDGIDPFDVAPLTCAGVTTYKAVKVAGTRSSNLVGRDEDLGMLERLARAGTYTLLEAPRRYGKTSLLKATAHRWRENEQALAVWVDFSAVLTVEEAARRIHDAYEDTRAHGRLSDLLRELVASIRLRLGPIEVGPVRPAADVDQAAMLHRLLEVPLAVAHRTGRRALVAFDEFQDVLAVPGLDGLLRSHIQHHADHVTYVFSGSEPSLLGALFADQARPLYGQAKPLRLKPIAPELLASAIAEKFATTGRAAGEGGQGVASIGAGHPQRTMLLAWHLWEITAAGATATLELAQRALADALTDRRAELEAISQALSTVEQRVTVAVAHGLAPKRLARTAGHRNPQPLRGPTCGEQPRGARTAHEGRR